MGILGDLLASLAVALLRALWARHDLKETVRLDIALATAEVHRQALAWMATVDPATAARLRVLDGAQPLTFTCPSSDPLCAAHALPMPPGPPSG